MTVPPAVEVSDCSYSYGGARALDGVSFTVPQGAIFGLLGPNGSGKTTLFRILSTLLVPESGRARLFGQDVADCAADARRQIGVVFQTQSLDRRLSVEENLVHQGHLHGMRGAPLATRVSEVLGKVGLDDRRSDRVSTLSGGLKRRVDLAKGLLHSPKLLLLDEPSTGIDPGARLSFWQYLRDLRRSDGVTVVLTTHLLDEANRCDRIAILDRGKLIREGCPRDLKAEVGGNVVTVSTPDAAAFAKAIELEFGLGDALVDGHEVRFEHMEGARWATRLMERFGKRIDAVRVSRPSLEDVFLHHAGHGFDKEGAAWRERRQSTS